MLQRKDGERKLVDVAEEERDSDETVLADTSSRSGKGRERTVRGERDSLHSRRADDRVWTTRAGQPVWAQAEVPIVASSHAGGDEIDCRVASMSSGRALAGKRSVRVSSGAIGEREGAREGAQEGGRYELRRRLVEIRRRLNSSGTSRVLALPHLHSPRPISFGLLPLALSTVSTPEGLLLLGDEFALGRHEQNGVPFLTKEVLFEQAKVA